MKKLKQTLEDVGETLVIGTLTIIFVIGCLTLVVLLGSKIVEFAEMFGIIETTGCCAMLLFIVFGIGRLVKSKI